MIRCIHNFPHRIYEADTAQELIAMAYMFNFQTELKKEKYWVMIVL